MRCRHPGTTDGHQEVVLKTLPPRHAGAAAALCGGKFFHETALNRCITNAQALRWFTDISQGQQGIIHETKQERCPPSVRELVFIAPYS
jgi:hypothetical protein